MKNKGVFLVLVLLLIAASFVAGTYYTKSQNLEKQVGKNQPAQNNPLPAQVKPTSTVLDADTLKKLYDGAWSKGKKEAKVTIVEFSDFECPFCGRYSTQTFPEIDKNYIQTGKVLYFFRNSPLPFHANAQKAAEAAECAGEQGKFWEMHDKIFANQTKITVTDLKSYADSLKLNTGKFNSCLDSGKYQSKVQDDAKLGQGVGVNGTPTFYINGRLVSGALPYDNFKTIIEEELAK